MIEEFKQCSVEGCTHLINDGKQSGLCLMHRRIQGKRNKRKGNVNESRFAKYLQDQFDRYELPYRARRTPRSGAIHEFEPADIMIMAPPDSIFKGVHFENKDTEHWYIEDWYKKALEIEAQRGLNRRPVIIMRKPNATQEFAVVDKDFLIELMISIEKMR